MEGKQQGFEDESVCPPPASESAVYAVFIRLVFPLIP